MMRPDRCFIIGRTTALEQLKAPLRLMLRIKSQSASLMRIIRLSRVVPALLTRMSTRPNSSMARSIMALALALSATSTLTAMACWPVLAVSSLAVASAFSSCRSATTTLAPCPARASAMARPMP